MEKTITSPMMSEVRAPNYRESRDVRASPCRADSPLVTNALPSLLPTLFVPHREKSFVGDPWQCDNQAIRQLSSAAKRRYRIRLPSARSRVVYLGGSHSEGTVRVTSPQGRLGRLSPRNARHLHVHLPNDLPVLPDIGSTSPCYPGARTIDLQDKGSDTDESSDDQIWIRMTSTSSSSTDTSTSTPVSIYCPDTPDIFLHPEVREDSPVSPSEDLQDPGTTAEPTEKREDTLKVPVNVRSMDRAPEDRFPPVRPPSGPSREPRPASAPWRRQPTSSSKRDVAAERTQGIVSRVLSGDVTELPPLRSTEVNVYLCSTGSDMTNERRALFEDAVPVLRDFCRGLGLSFQLVDMRAGVPDVVYASAESRLLCCKEIEECQRRSHGPNFVALVGNRYGELALPTTLPVEDFHLLHTMIDRETPEDTPLMEQYYRKDTNRTPPAYIQLTREQSSPEDTKAHADTECSKLQKAMLSAANLAHAQGIIPEERLRPYMISVLENELQLGVLSVVDARRRCIVFLRNLEGITEDVDNPVAKFYIDVETRGKTNILDREAQGRLSELKERQVREVIGEGNIHTYAPWWQVGGLEPEHCRKNYNYLKLMTRHFLAGIKKLINAACKQNKQNDINIRGIPIKTYKEILSHSHIMKTHVSRLSGSADLPPKLINILTNEEGGNKTVIITGGGASGKSSALAKVFQHLPELLGLDSIRIFRSIKEIYTTQSLRSLLMGLCMQISSVYKLKTEGRSLNADIYQLAVCFHRMLFEVGQLYKEGPAKKALVIMLDDVDMLGGFKSLEVSNPWFWLPCSNPPGVYIITTCSVNNEKGLPTRHWENNVELTAFPRDKIGEIIDNYLMKHKRTLSPEQRHLLDRRTAEGTPSALFTEVLSSSAARWQSDEPVSQLQLAATLEEAILWRVKDLGLKTSPAFAKYVIGYITVCLGGVTGAELEDVMAESEDVLNDVIRDSNAPPGNVVTIPTLHFARMRDTFDVFLNQNIFMGTRMLRWAHDQLSAIFYRYLTRNDGHICSRLHGDLADMFLRETHSYNTTDQQTALKNIPARLLVCLPYHMINTSPDRRKTMATICLSFNWLSTKIRLISTEAVIQDICRFMEISAPEDERELAILLECLQDLSRESTSSAVVDIATYILGHIPLVCRQGDILGPLTTDASMALRDASKTQLIPVFPSLPSSDPILIGHIHGPVCVIGFAPNGNVIILKDSDENVILMDMDSLEAVFVVSPNTDGELSSCHLSSDGEHLLLNPPGKIILFRINPWEQVLQADVNKGSTRICSSCVDKEKLTLSVIMESSSLLQFDMKSGELLRQTDTGHIDQNRQEDLKEMSPKVLAGKPCDNTLTGSSAPNEAVAGGSVDASNPTSSFESGSPGEDPGILDQVIHGLDVSDNDLISEVTGCTELPNLTPDHTEDLGGSLLTSDHQETAVQGVTSTDQQITLSTLPAQEVAQDPEWSSTNIIPQGGCPEGTVSVMSLASSNEEGGNESITDMIFSADSTQLAICLQQEVGHLILWDMDRMDSRGSLSCYSSGRFSRPVFNKAGTVLVVGIGHTDHAVVSVKSGQITHVLKGDTGGSPGAAPVPESKPCFTADDRYILVPTGISLLGIFDVKNGRRAQTLLSLSSCVMSAFDDTDLFVFGYETSGNVIIWYSPTGEVVHHLAAHNDIGSVYFRVNGTNRFLYTCSSGEASLKVWDIGAILSVFRRRMIGFITNDEIRVYEMNQVGENWVSEGGDHDRPYSSGVDLVSHVKNVNFFISVAGHLLPDGDEIESGRTPKCKQPDIGWLAYPTADTVFTDVLMSTDGHYVFTAHPLRGVQLWSVSSGVLVTTIQTPEVTQMSLANDGLILVCITARRQLQLYNLERSCWQMIDIVHGVSGVDCDSVTVSADSKTLVVIKADNRHKGLHIYAIDVCTCHILAHLYEAHAEDLLPAEVISVTQSSDNAFLLITLRRVGDSNSTLVVCDFHKEFRLETPGWAQNSGTPLTTPRGRTPTPLDIFASLEERSQTQLEVAVGKGECSQQEDGDVIAASQGDTRQGYPGRREVVQDHFKEQEEDVGESCDSCPGGHGHNRTESLEALPLQESMENVYGSPNPSDKLDESALPQQVSQGDEAPTQQEGPGEEVGQPEGVEGIVSQPVETYEGAPDTSVDPEGKAVREERNRRVEAGGEEHQNREGQKDETSIQPEDADCVSGHAMESNDLITSGTEEGPSMTSTNGQEGQNGHSILLHQEDLTQGTPEPHWSEPTDPKESELHHESGLNTNSELSTQLEEQHDREQGLPEQGLSGSPSHLPDTTHIIQDSNNGLRDRTGDRHLHKVPWQVSLGSIQEAVSETPDDLPQGPKGIQAEPRDNQDEGDVRRTLTSLGRRWHVTPGLTWESMVPADVTGRRRDIGHTLRYGRLAILPASDVILALEGPEVLIGTRSGNIVVWDMGAARISRIFSAGEVSEEDYNLILRSEMEADETRSLPGGAHSGSVRSLTMARNFKYVIAASDDSTLTAWDLQTETLVSRMEGHKAAVTYGSASEDASYVISSSRDRTVRLWCLVSGHQLCLFDTHVEVSKVSFGFDARHVVVRLGSQVPYRLAIFEVDLQHGDQN